MSANRTKKIFLAATVIVPFLLYCMYYYGMIIKNAPYKFAEFQSMVFKYGKGDSLVNQYNSKTGDYQYMTKSGHLVKKNIHLNKDELLYLHRKASDLGFWDFPANEQQLDTSIKIASPRYYMEFNYEHKSKKVMYDDAFDGDPSLKDANQRLIKEIQKVLDEAEIRQGK